MYRRTYTYIYTWYVRLFVVFHSIYLPFIPIGTHILTCNRTSDRNQFTHSHIFVYIWQKWRCTHMSENRTFVCWLSIVLDVVVVVPVWVYFFSHLKSNDSMEFSRWHAPFTYKFISFDFAFTNGLTISTIPIHALDNGKREVISSEDFIFYYCCCSYFSWVRLLFGMCLTWCWLPYHYSKKKYSEENKSFHPFPIIFNVQFWIWI